MNETKYLILPYRFVTETSENIFLTGKAGTGKTTFLKISERKLFQKYYCCCANRCGCHQCRRCYITQFISIALSSFFTNKKQQEELLAKIRFNKQRQQLLRKMELLVIDEISMVRCDTMDAIDTILKSVRRKHQIPFGGVQLLCIGDLHQLPPVAQSQEWSILQEYYLLHSFLIALLLKNKCPC